MIQLCKIFSFGIFIIVSFYLNVNSAQAVYPLGTELIMYHFEEVATGTTTDAISATTTNSGSGGSTYDGTLGNNASTTSAVKLFGSRSAYFNETGDFLNTYYGNGINPTTQSISVSFWVYKGNNNCSTADEHVFGTGVSGQNTRYYIRCKNSTTNKWDYRIQGNLDFYSTNSVATTSWDHIVLVTNATTDTAIFYVNGVAIGAPAAYTTYTIPGNFYIGNLNDVGAPSLNQGSGAYVDEVAIYNTALTASDVTVLYQAGATSGVISSFTALPYESRAYLSWNAGSGTTTDYLVEYKLASEPTVWTTFNEGVSTTTNATVTGLTNNLSYNFRVTPKNGEVLGTVSSTVSAAPRYFIEFVSPTPTNGSTLQATSFTVYASTTPVTPASTTDTIRLENSVGGLISQVSTTTRYGDYNLTHLYNTLANSDLALNNNSSGISYVPTTDTLFIVHNAATGANSTIDEVDKNGSLIRAITCTTCGDIEGITLISSVASSTVGGFDHTFMLSSENDTANAEIYRVVIHSTGAVTLNKNDYYDTGITHGSNLGLEGIAYNSSSGLFYVVREKTTPAIFEIKLGIGRSATSNQICTNLDFSTIATDFSDVFYNNNTLFVLSHENNRLIPVNITSTSTCAFVDSDGDGSSGTTIDTGDYLNTLPVGVTVQPEGLTWDTTGDTLWVLGEADFLAKYRSMAYTTRHTFSGLSNGDYVIKASSLDTYGQVANALSRDVTLNIDVISPSVSVTAPTNSSTVSGNSVTVSASASDDTAVTGVTFKVDTNTTIGSEDTSAPYSVSWNSTGIADGSHTLIAVARDAVGNIATSSAVTVTVDNTAPVRSAGAPTGTLAVGSTGTIISLNTNESATCKYSATLGTAYGSMTVFAVTDGTSHTSSVAGLTNATSYNYYVKCQDGQGNINASDYGISFSVAADISAPLLSSISSGTPGNNSATITWTTDENSSSKVYYGLTSLLGTSTVEADTSPRVTSHSVLISGLTACTLYSYSVRSIDSGSNISTSTVGSFHTSGCAGSASVVDETVSSITNSSGGSLDLVSGGKGPTLDIPAGFSSVNADFQIKKLNSGSVIGTTGLPSGLALAGDQIYDFKAYSDVSTPITSFNESIDVTIAYTNSDISGLVESTLTIKRWNGTSWSSLTSCTVNGSANTVSCSTTNFSVFGLFGETNPTPPPPEPEPASTPSVSISSVSSGGTAQNRVNNLLAMGFYQQAFAVAKEYGIAMPTLSNNIISKVLSFGSIDEQVKLVQKVLNLNSDTKVANSGAGSVGKETKTFLAQTRRAVQVFQLKYGIVKSSKDIGYGRVGPATRAKMNEILISSER